MRTRTVLRNFRFSDADILQLDWIVDVEKKARSPGEWGPEINRTSVLRSLIHDRKADLEAIERKKNDAREVATVKQKTKKTANKKGAKK